MSRNNADSMQIRRDIRRIVLPHLRIGMRVPGGPVVAKAIGRSTQMGWRYIKSTLNEAGIECERQRSAKGHNILVVSKIPECIDFGKLGKTSMARLLLLSTAMLAIASPAVAWTNTTNGAGPQQIVDGGPGAQSTARASAGAVANQRVVVRVNPAPSGASTGAGSVGTAVGAGSGGPSTGPGAGAGSYNGATYVDNRAAPSIGLAPLYGGGARCPTVGLTGAGSATGGGGGAGVSWYSSDCSTIEMAEYMRSIGRGDVGQALLAHHYPELAQVLADMPVTPAIAVAPVPVVRPAWCDKAQRNRHPTEASAAYIAKECE